MKKETFKALNQNELNSINGGRYKVRDPETGCVYVYKNDGTLIKIKC